MSKYVFVYGTLKRGHPMGDWLNSASEFQGESVIVGSLYNLGCFPGYKNGLSGLVYGEIFKVTDTEVLKRLDEYEGVPDLYRRITVPALATTHETMGPLLVETYEYIPEVSEDQCIKGGVWNDD